MRKEQVVLDFVREPIVNKIEFGRNVVIKLTGNPNFLHPDLTIEELTAKNDLLEKRSVTSLSGGKEATALLNQTKTDWDNTYRKMARYVDRIADGDSAIILSSGFNLMKQHAPAVRPEFEVELGDKSGSVWIHHQAVAGARSYIWQYSTGEMPASEGNWTTAEVTSRANVELIGLTPLTKYWFRVAAVTVTGTMAYCQPIAQVIL